MHCVPYEKKWGSLTAPCRHLRVYVRTGGHSPTRDAQAQRRWVSALPLPRGHPHDGPTHGRPQAIPPRPRVQGELSNAVCFIREKKGAFDCTVPPSACLRAQRGPRLTQGRTSAAAVGVDPPAPVGAPSRRLHSRVGPTCCRDAQRGTAPSRRREASAPVPPRPPPPAPPPCAM